MNSGTLVYASVGGVCAGIATVFVFSTDNSWTIIPFGLVAILLTYSYVRKTERIWFLIAGLFCVGFGIGIIRAQYALAEFERQNILSFANAKPVSVEGIIIADPDRRETATHINVSVVTIDGQSANGALVAYLPGGQQVAYGDHVVLHGVIEVPQPFAGDAENVFDYGGYLQVQDISAVLAHAKIDSVQKGRWSILGSLYEVKATLDDSISQRFGDPESALLKGMLFGQRRGLPKELQQTLVSVGLIHIVILAGYALGLVADGVRRAARFLPKFLQMPVVAAFLIGYVFMTGAAPATVRASIMAMIAMLARMGGRVPLAMRSLAIATAGMALWNPPLLLKDSAFIISVLATFGLITLAPALEKVFHFLPERFELRQIATSTLAVQIFALPALLYFTGAFSLVSVPANLLALPALPWAILFGFLCAILNLISPMLAFVPLFMAYGLVHYILFIAQTTAAIPFGFAVVSNFPLWAAILVYIPLIIFALRAYGKHAVQDKNLILRSSQTVPP